MKPLIHVPRTTVKNSFVSSDPKVYRVSLPLTEEIIKSKEDLRKMIIIKVIFGNSSARSLTVSLSEVLNSDYCRAITP